MKYLGHIIGRGTTQTDPDKGKETGLEIGSLSVDDGILVDLLSEHFQTAEYNGLRQNICDNQCKFPDLKVLDGFVYKRTEHATGEQLHVDLCWKLWVPRELVNEILIRAHFGINKTLERVRKCYFWPGLVNSVRNYINSCEKCKSTKHPNFVVRPPMGQPYMTLRVFQKLYVDFLGPFPRSRSGHIGIFVVLDNFSKFPFLKPVKKMTADVVCKFLEEEIFHIFGVPETIVSDNGVQFKSKLFKQLLNRYQIFHTLTAVHSPQANASERINRSVLSAIRAYVSPDKRNWDEVLSNIACALRSSVHSSIGIEPYYMAFGQNMITNWGPYSLLRRLNVLEDRSVSFSREDSMEIIRKRALELMERQFQRNERKYNLRSKMTNFKEGQEVYRRNFKQSKLDNVFVRARIRRKIGNCYYDMIFTLVNIMPKI